MGPAASTILGDVLISRHGQVVDAVDVPPGKGVREVVVPNLRVERVVRALRRGVAAPDETRGLDLVLLPDLRAARRWRLVPRRVFGLRISARRAFTAARSLDTSALDVSHNTLARGSGLPRPAHAGDGRARATRRAKQAL